MRLREHEAVLSKSDQFMVDPRLLKVDPSYNVRDLGAPDERAALDELKEQIRASGVRTALEIRIQGQDVFIVAGHRRHKVVMELIAEGEPIQKIPATQEPAGTGEADRVANLVISNSGKPLTPLQVAEVVRRLLAFGWEKSQVAKRLGWKSTTSVNQYLDMLAMPEQVKEHVRKGEISATLARNIAKGVDPKFAAELIEKNLEENKRITGSRKRSTKVTAKTIKRDAAPGFAKGGSFMVPLCDETHEAPQQQEREHVEPQSLSATADAHPVSAPAAAAVAAPAEPLSGIPENRVEPPRGDPASDQGVVRIGEYVADYGPLPNWKKVVADALLPFARCSELNDLNERDDDDVLEIPVRDVKRAAAAWFALTGLSQTGNGALTHQPSDDDDEQQDRSAA
jgi:ParB-like chromosome segregation protein Spo0J